MKARFKGQKAELLRGSVLFLKVEAVEDITAMLTIQSSSIPRCQVEEDFFVPNIPHSGCGTALGPASVQATVTAMEGCIAGLSNMEASQCQDRALHAERAPTCDGTAPISVQPQQLSNPQVPSEATQGKPLKDEYDYDRFTHDYFEYEQGQKSILVKGRLKMHINFWRSIGASDFILDIIENGYKIPFSYNQRKHFAKTINLFV